MEEILKIQDITKKYQAKNGEIIAIEKIQFGVKTRRIY